MRRKIIKKTTNKAEFNLKNVKFYVLSTICGFMVVASLFMTIESSTNGAEMANLQKKEAELLSQQQELQQKLVESLSVNNLAELSSQHGFVKVSNLVYAQETVSVAAKLP